ncbi:RING finger protein 214 isoform X2 [Latimeria chalumnae]|uniref:RING finger protein 214 isoform X2 n=1 Tax=Latimeria chalumnae TaxID=7897 RepID=UPI0003C11395|nr:PREDICTED: RING finger protein 214 isoform X2 [Latimeria chalumnae]|eukprot:XP_005988216.1 PREDICTED: RING finger protein 214 isoform X2 [Latimeria chalumnae]
MASILDSQAGRNEESDTFQAESTEATTQGDDFHSVSDATVTACEDSAAGMETSPSENSGGGSKWPDVIQAQMLEAENSEIYESDPEDSYFDSVVDKLENMEMGAEGIPVESFPICFHVPQMDLQFPQREDPAEIGTLLLSQVEGVPAFPAPLCVSAAVEALADQGGRAGGNFLEEQSWIPGTGNVHSAALQGTAEPSETCDVTAISLFQDASVQTDFKTVETEVNTDQDIEKYMEEVMSERKVLKECYQEVLDKQRQVENQLQENIKQLSELMGRKEDVKKKLEKEKKEFLQKEQDLQSEIEKLQENSKRLLKELEEKESRVAALIGEQTVEKEVWELEISELKLRQSKLNKTILGETERAVKAEVAALENRRDITIMKLDDAAKEAEQKLQQLRLLPARAEVLHQRNKWETRLADIKAKRDNIGNQFNSHLQLVQNGAKLSSLPQIAVPSLHPAPAELMIPSSVSMPAFHLPPFPLTGASVSMATQFPLPPPPAFQGRTTPVSAAPVGSSSVPMVPAPIPPPPGLSFQAPLEAQSLQPHAKSGDKLEKLLEKLLIKFPQCTRSQLTHILQQIKTSRGTMAGLLMEELAQQVALRLADQQAQMSAGVHVQPLGHVWPPGFPAHVPQMNPPSSLPPGRTAAQASYTGKPSMTQSSRKLCLMCQEIVQLNDVHPMACSHTVHKECIKFWAQSNKNSSCPFCPTQR